MTTSHLWIMLLALLLLATAASEPVALHANDYPDDVDHGQHQLTTIYLPIAATDLPMSSISSPAPTATAVIPPPVN